MTRFDPIKSRFNQPKSRLVNTQCDSGVHDATALAAGLGRGGSRFPSLPQHKAWLKPKAHTAKRISGFIFVAQP
jgi:hypothetical protein